MDKKRVFISQPMKNRTREDIEAERKLILGELPALAGIDGIIEIPMLSEVMVASNTPVHCLGCSVQDLSNAELAVFAPGWRNARGCAIEHAVCCLYRIPFMELSNDGNGYFVTKELDWNA